MCRILVHKFELPDCGHSFLYRDSCRYNNNIICKLSACDVFYETFPEEKCELCHKRDAYMADERRMAERRRELANIERELQLELEIEHKREKLAKLRRRHAETDDQKEDEDTEELEEKPEERQSKGMKSESPEESDDMDMADVAYEARDEK